MNEPFDEDELARPFDELDNGPTSRLRVWPVVIAVGVSTLLAIVLAINLLNVTVSRSQKTAATLEDIKRLEREQMTEGRERRDETCVAFERDAAVAVNAVTEARESLANTKRYLRELTPSERQTTLNRFVRQGLSRQRREIERAEDEARAATAPPYCDEKGVGLPEPTATPSP